MPPSKRTKKSPSIPRSPSSSRPSSEDSDLLDDNVNTDDYEEEEAYDPALLDEEETPGGSDRKPLRGAYAAGGRGYNALKTFKGQVYSGMAVGGSHTWNYDQGVWKETKEEPDLWKIDYKTTKRRARTAPKGSGAPVGTGYHWLIVAHQYVTKMDANTYDTHLVGAKYKLAHQSVTSNAWSIPTVKAQREREIELLEDAKRRVQGLPPVLAEEKVKVDKPEKGQQKLDSMFAKVAAEGKKRKRGEGDSKEEVDARDGE
ncbi:hypothetical protein VTN77DRAFT_8439 [Rasamsonia byssochlamydoides]|uniref:uncharacterized protein n=1 Tax=Rasamsonia byssochlamydoides TaxID=89139 RepID=UPI003743D929